MVLCTVIQCILARGPQIQGICADFHMLSKTLYSDCTQLNLPTWKLTFKIPMCHTLHVFLRPLVALNLSISFQHLSAHYPALSHFAVHINIPPTYGSPRGSACLLFLKTHFIVFCEAFRTLL